MIIMVIMVILVIIVIMVITFLYTGRAEVKEELLVDFMALTEDLGVEGLANPSNITQEDDDKRNLSGMIDDFDYDDKSDIEVTKETKMKRVKSDILKFYCEKCNRHFNIEANFDKHKLMHEKGDKRLISRRTNNRKGPFLVPIPDIDEDGFYPCNNCDKRISDRSNYRRHFRRDHLKIEHKCGECDYSSTDSVNLRIHMKKRHNKQFFKKNNGI